MKKKEFLTEVERLENQVEKFLDILDQEGPATQVKVTQLLRWNENTNTIIRNVFGYNEQIKFGNVSMLSGIDHDIIESHINGDPTDWVVNVGAHLKTLIKDAREQPDFYLQELNKRMKEDVTSSRWTWVNVKEHPVGIICACCIIVAGIVAALYENIRIPILKERVETLENQISSFKEGDAMRASPKIEAETE